MEERLKKWGLADLRNSQNFAGIKGEIRVGERVSGTPIIKETPNKVPDIAILLLEIRLANPQMKQEDWEKMIAEIAETSKIDLDALKFPFFMVPVYSQRRAKTF